MELGKVICANRNCSKQFMANRYNQKYHHRLCRINSPAYKAKRHARSISKGGRIQNRIRSGKWRKLHPQRKREQALRYSHSEKGKKRKKVWHKERKGLNSVEKRELISGLRPSPKSVSKARTTQEVNNIIKSRNFKWIAGIYFDTKSPLLVKCSNDHETIKTVNDLSAWAGCGECKASSGELLTRRILEYIFDEKFPKQRPSWLLGLELDGYNQNLKLAFEFQGPQHEAYHPRFHKERDLKATQKADTKKGKICLGKKIFLIKVSYRLAYKEFWDYIIKALKKRRGITVNKQPLDYKSIIKQKEKEDEIRKIVASKSIEVLDSDFSTWHDREKFHCKVCGCEWETRLSKIKSGGDSRNGTGCPTCAIKKRALKRIKHSIISLRNFAKKKRGDCKSKDYNGYSVKHEWVCKYGHEWMATPRDIFSGRWCPRCARKRDKKK